MIFKFKFKLHTLFTKEIKLFHFSICLPSVPTLVHMADRTAERFRATDLPEFLSQTVKVGKRIIIDYLFCLYSSFLSKKKSVMVQINEHAIFAPIWQHCQIAKRKLRNKLRKE